MSEMWYNLTNVNASNMLTFVQSVDSSFMKSSLGSLILIIIFVVSWRSFMEFNNNPKVSFMASCLAVAIVSVILRLLSFINDLVLFYCWALLALTGAIIIIFQSGR